MTKSNAPKPLTKREYAERNKLPYPAPAPPKIVVCQKCKKPGGTLTRINKGERPTRYEHSVCP